jgi:hypothetical protein
MTFAGKIVVCEDNHTPRKVTMDYSTQADDMPQDSHGLLVDVHSVYAHLLEIPNPRKARGCRYEWVLTFC